MSGRGRSGEDERGDVPAGAGRGLLATLAQAPDKFSAGENIIESYGG